MFYSNQLLSRKGPFAQIWIAATMHAKINRRKAEKIDIAEVCDQILNPAVPLALRLSGILMGGVVLIYDRKVKFFSEDVNNLLIQIKLITASNKSDASSLSKGKSKARFEAITIEYDEYSEIETAMLQTSKTSDDEIKKMERFFTIRGELEPPERDENFHHRFQVAQDSITIQEDPLQPEGLVRFDNDDRIPPPDDLIVDDICPEYQPPDESPPILVLDLAVDEEMQQSTVHGSKHTVAANATRSSEGSPEYRRTKRRQKKRKRPVIDLDFTEVPAPVFNTWLKCTADILGNRREKSKILKIDLTLTVDHEKNLRFPSSSLFWNARSGTNSVWASPLIDLWNLCTTNPNYSKSASSDDHEPFDQSSGQQRRCQTVDVAEIESQFYADMSMIDPEEIMQGNIREQTTAPNYVDYGSIEKLRSALNTPITKTHDLFINQLGLTPRPSGQNGRRKAAIPLATPSSGRLSLDKEEEFPRYSTVSSTRRSCSTGMDMSPGFEMQADDYLKETISTNYRLGNDGDFLGSALSQFVLEETLPSQDVILRSPQIQGIDAVTTSLLGILRERFDQSPIISSEDLFVGLGRSNAAKLFYQICVMASNRFISVDQMTPYGAIFLKRGARAYC